VEVVFLIGALVALLAFALTWPPKDLPLAADRAAQPAESLRLFKAG
jgi:hypothetical protein